MNKKFLRRVQQSFLGGIRTALNFSGIRKTRTVVFSTRDDFHMEHLLPVIQELHSCAGVSILIVHASTISKPKNIENITLLSEQEFFSARWRFFDAIVATDYDGFPWWFRSGNRISVAHGTGPKSGYLDDIPRENIDYVFSPGPLLFNEQIRIIGNSKDCRTVVEKTGLPVTDSFSAINNTENAETVSSAKKSTVLYAPSWSQNPDMVSMDVEILNNLASLDACRVIIRPHPNLLIPDICGGMDWKTILSGLEENGCELSLSGSVYELLPQSDLIIGDISSLMYEFLVLDRPGILYVKDIVLENSIIEEARKPLLNAFHRIKSASELGELVEKLLHLSDPKSSHREKLIQSAFYNIGCAAEVSAQRISEIVFSRESMFKT